MPTVAAEANARMGVEAGMAGSIDVTYRRQLPDGTLMTPSAMKALHEKVPCVPLPCYICCRCLVPRWSRWPICFAVVYAVLSPFVYFIGHFAVYPGDPFKYDGDLTCTEFSFSSPASTDDSSGRRTPGVRCLYGKKGDNPTPALVFGGNAMNMYSSALTMPFILPETESWEVFSISMPGAQYAPREGWTTPDVALQDAEALLAHIFEESRRPSAIFGWSLGSSLAAGLAARAPTERVQCVMLGNPFTSIRAVALSWTFYLVVPYIYLFDDWPTESWVRHFQAPTIVLSSNYDSVVPLPMHRAVFAAANASKKQLIERNASHMAFRPFKVPAAERIQEWCIARSP